MDLINKILNILIAPSTFLFLCWFLPPYLAFKSFLSILTSAFFTENVFGKVILITGASSGIGEHLAYEYARKGACLVLAARREKQLRAVAEQCLVLGSPDVIVIRADVSEVEDCERMIDHTIYHYGRLDHLVNNAGITSVSLFEDCEDMTKLQPVIDVNFWGSVYTTRFAIPYLRHSKGKIIAMSSVASWLPAPRMCLYNASKAANVALYESLRLELWPDIGVTIVTPGFVESEMTQGKFLSKEGDIKWDQEIRDTQISLIPVVTAERSAKIIVDGVCRGKRSVTMPAWFKVTRLWTMAFPELIEWGNRVFYLTRGDEQPISKSISDVFRINNQ